MVEQQQRPQNGPIGRLASARWWRAAVHLGIALCFAASWACGDLLRQSRSSSYLIINSLGARSGADDTGEFASPLHSDVITFQTTVFEDLGQVTFSLGLKDPGTPATPNAPTATNAITVTRYRVEYRRSDGRNTPGVDVPLPFEGGMTLTVAGTASSTFTIVRATAKKEAPLTSLAENLNIIHTVAHVTFYGHDQTGTMTSVTGYVDVHFANWPDPD